MPKILLIGNGAREHVIGETLKKNPAVSLIVFAKAKNPGLAKLADFYQLTPALNDFDILKILVQAQKPDLAFVGPEDPLEDGIVDFLAGLNVPSASPPKALAQLETSKGFTRNLLSEYKIPGNPDFKIFHSSQGLREYIEKDLQGQFVVKADGLKGGKGVKVMGDHLASIEEGLVYAEECLKESGKVVIEEKLIGQEFSLMSFADGKTVIDMPLVQDHKRAFEGDLGPNTGGMGSYSMDDHSLPFLRDSDRKEAHAISEKVMQAIEKECGVPYRGIMYGGFIATKSGVRLIEYNARFGDPEAMNVLPLLKTDLATILQAIVEQSLATLSVGFTAKASVCKYVVPEGYPDNPVKNVKISVAPMPEGVLTYYASVDERNDGLYLLGSRAVAVVGIGHSLEDAEKKAQSAANRVHGAVFFRKDIGTRVLLEKRIEMMAQLRNS